MPKVSMLTQKTCAIGHFPTPTTVTEPQRFMGMVNQLGKFVPGLADINALTATPSQG